jgi:hypothetical protein
MSDADEKKGAQPPRGGLGAKPQPVETREGLRREDDSSRALRDSRDWLRKVLFNLSREFELAAYQIGKQ